MNCLRHSSVFFFSYIPPEFHSRISQEISPEFLRSLINYFSEINWIQNFSRKFREFPDFLQILCINSYLVQKLHLIWKIFNDYFSTLQHGFFFGKSFTESGMPFKDSSISLISNYIRTSSWDKIFPDIYFYNFFQWILKKILKGFVKKSYKASFTKS